jgi:hypothetical protein
MGERVCAYAELLSSGADEMVLGNFKSKFADGHELGENREEPNLMGAWVAVLSGRKHRGMRG